MFCKQCGKTLPEGAQFCTGCGAQLGGAPAPTSAPAATISAASAPAAKASMAKVIFLIATAFTALFALIAMIVYIVDYGKYHSGSSSTYSFAGWSEIGLFLAAAAGLGLSFSAMRDNALYRALPPVLFAFFGLADAVSIIAISANAFSTYNSYYTNTSSPLGGIITRNVFLMIALLAFNGIAAMLLMKRIQLSSAVMVGGLVAALLMIIMGFICGTALFGFAVLFFVAAYLPEIIKGDVAKSFAATAQTKLSTVATESSTPAAAPVAYPAPAPQASPADQFCPSCGKGLSADAEFCTGCGTKMQ